MKTISRSLAGEAVVGDAIELPWPLLDRNLDLHTKELVVVAAAPSAGKSVFALGLATNMKAPVLYLAQDSVPSVLARIAALALGVEISWAFDTLRHPKRKAQLIKELEDTYPNLFINQGAVTIEQIEDRLIALTEILGSAPKMVVIDNLIDLIIPGHHHQEVGFYATAFNPLKQMAQKHNTMIMALHHIKKEVPTQALKVTDLLYAGDREAEHVLGIYHEPDKTKMYVQILKQRDGAADGEGGVKVPLVWHPALGTLGRA